MASQKLVPVPSGVRPLFWVLRGFGVILGVAALYLAALAVGRGEPGLAAGALVVGGGFAALTWMHPLNKWTLPTLVGLAALVAALVRSWIVVVLILGNVLLISWLRRSGGRGILRLRPESVAVAPPDSVMKKARPFVAEFGLAGYEQVGALRFSVGPMKVTVSLLLAGDDRSYASVTDATMSVSSLFPDGRSLVTLNNNLAQLAPTALTDVVNGGSPTEMVESHRRALAALAERGHYPLRIAAPELPQIAADRERAGIVWATTHGNRAQRSDAGPLWSRDDLADLIAAWHGSAGPLHPE